MTNLKNILVTVFTVLMTLTSYGQITDINKTKVGELSMTGVIQGTMYTYEDGTYVFTYKDYKYRHIDNFKSITFQNIDEVKQFKEIIETQMTMKKKSKRDIQLSDGTTLHLTTNKSFGMVGVSIVPCMTGIVSITGVNQNQMEKLFGFIS